MQRSSLASRFRPHPVIPGAHVLDWGGEEFAVTFDPAVFDRHPSTVRLLSYGNRLLADMLDEVPRPTNGSEREGLLSRYASTPAPTAWFGWREAERVQAVTSVASLRRALSKTVSSWTEEDVESAEAAFEAARVAVASRYEQTQVEKNAAEVLALKEQARRILVETALIDAARSEQASLLEATAGPRFGLEAVKALDDQGTPYRALLHIVLAGEAVSADPEDPYYESLAGKNAGTLTKHRNELRKRGIDLLERWRAVQALNPVLAPRSEHSWTRWLAASGRQEETPGEEVAVSTS